MTEKTDQLDAYELAVALSRDAIEGADVDVMDGDDLYAHFASAVVDALASRADILGALYRGAEARDFNATVRDAWSAR